MKKIQSLIKKLKSAMEAEHCVSGGKVLVCSVSLCGEEVMVNVEAEKLAVTDLAILLFHLNGAIHGELASITKDLKTNQ